MVLLDWSEKSADEMMSSAGGLTPQSTLIQNRTRDRAPSEHLKDNRRPHTTK